MVFTVPVIDDSTDDETYTPEALAKLRRDLREGARDLTEQEVRYIVQTYYTVQDYRIKSSNQMRSLGKEEKPIALLGWIFDSISMLEAEITKWMLAYSSSRPTGKWMLSVCGIGPVISAGILANLNLDKTTNISKFWAFAGLDPTKSWTKGQIRPWNADLKVLTYKAGESFVKVQNRESDFYGKLYAQRKAEYIKKNDAGGYAERAAFILTQKKYSQDTDAYAAYSSGKLPPAHIHAMARRWCVKIFLSHVWAVAYEEKYNMVAPRPWILEPGLGGHTDVIKVPNHECPYGDNH